MKVKYTIKENNGNVTVPEIVIQDLNDAQFEYIKRILYEVLNRCTLFTEEDRDEFGGQNLINQITMHLRSTGNEATLIEEQFKSFVKSDLNKLEASLVKQPTEEFLKKLDERHRQMCTGEWDGPETPYVKVIKDLYKDKDWSK